MTCVATLKNETEPITWFGRTSISSEPRTKLPAPSQMNAHKASHLVRGSPRAKNWSRNTSSASSSAASSGSQSPRSRQPCEPCKRCSAAVTTSTPTTARQARRLRLRSAWESNISKAPETTRVAPTAPCTSAGSTLPGNTRSMTLTRSHRRGRTTMAISRSPNKNVRTPASNGTQRRLVRRSLDSRPPESAAGGGAACSRSRPGFPVTLSRVGRAPSTASNEAERFSPRSVGLAERPPDGGGDGTSAGLANPAHRNAEVLALDDDDDAARLKNLLDGVRDLGGHPFLHLRPLCVDVDQPSQLRQAGDLAFHIGDVPHMGDPMERHEVVFTRAVDLDVFHDDHLVVT